MPPKHEVGFVNQAPQKRETYIQHHGIQAHETHEPKFPIAVLVEEYIDTLDSESRDILKTDSLAMHNAIADIISHSHESFEYTPIWEARVNENYKLADRLMLELQSQIRSRLLTAHSARINISDSDLSASEFDDFISSFSEFAGFEENAYARQEERIKKLEEGPTENELKGIEHGEKFFEEWKTNPAMVEEDLREARNQFASGNSAFNEDYIVAVERTFRNMKNEYEHALNIQKKKEASIKLKQEAQSSQTGNEDGVAKQETTDSSTPYSQQKKGENKMASPYSGYGSQSSRTTTTPKADAGFFNYDELPDGDQLEGTTEVEQEAIEGTFYKAQEFDENPTTKTRSRLDRMRSVRSDSPKLGKNFAASMQKGIALGRGTELPDADDTIEAKRVNFKRKPLKWLMTRADEMYRRHRKATNMMIKLTAVVAIQLGINTMAGRFEFKEDRHFVQTVFLTMASFFLTQSLKKDGMPVDQAAFVM